MTSLFLIFLLSASAAPTDRCAICHPKEVNEYARTGMGRSLSRPNGQPSGSFTHPFSGTKFTIVASPSGMRQRIEQKGVRAEHEIAYVVGSGNHGFSYLVRVGDSLFQSPLAYYTRRQKWDMAPGYEKHRYPDFDRPVTLKCLLCHSGRPMPVRGTLNRYAQPEFAAEAISCERCHGPTEAHLQQPSSTNIVNPRKLPQRARDSVCEQCHIAGETRIPNPGLSIADFRPGQRLEDVFSVYVFERTRATSADDDLKVVSHVEQLSLSECFRKSTGKMWCGSCHNPHENPKSPQQYYRARCLACHGATLAKSHAAASRNCIGCHMSKREVSDGGHTVFTDHRISRLPGKPGAGGQGQKLVAWHEPPGRLAIRNLGLANISVGRDDLSAYHYKEGSRLLSRYHRSSPGDPAVLEALGWANRSAGLHSPALRFFQEALRLRPGSASAHRAVAIAWEKVGDRGKAIATLDRAIKLDPSYSRAYVELSRIYLEARQLDKVRETISRFLKFMPNNLSARRALQRVKKHAAKKDRLPE